MKRTHSTVVALALCLSGCGSPSFQSSGGVASKPAPASTDKELVVKLSPSDIQHQPMFKISFSADGKPKFEEPKPEPMVRGDVDLDSQKVAIYIPARGPYSLKSEKTHSFENTSTGVFVDSNGDGRLDESECWWASMPIRLADSMFTVKDIDPGGTWIRFSRSSLPLSGVVVGKPCPPFSFQTMDGKTVSLADFKGKSFLLDVWSMT